MASPPKRLRNGAGDAVESESHDEGEGLEPVPRGGRGSARGGATRGVDLVQVAVDDIACVVREGVAKQGAREGAAGAGGAHRALSDAGSSPLPHALGDLSRLAQRSRTFGARASRNGVALPPRSGGRVAHPR